MDGAVTGPVRRIVIFRLNVWRSASSCWQLPTFVGRYGTILCRFTGDTDSDEPSADAGGPRLEFFSLLPKAILTESGVFNTGMSEEILQT